MDVIFMQFLSWRQLILVPVRPAVSRSQLARLVSGPTSPPTSHATPFTENRVRSSQGGGTESSDPISEIDCLELNCLLVYNLNFTAGKHVG